MGRKNRIAVILLVALLSLICFSAYARLSFEVGTGAVFSGRNDVRAPNISGTNISLSDELETDPNYFVRVRLAYSTGRHNIELFAAPLRLEASGRVNKLVKFEEEEFSANVPLTAVYRFDSYRLTYRYKVINTRRLQAGVGITANLRDGLISFEGSDKESEKKDTDVAPLINFKIRWALSRKLSFLIEGDMLPASQERIEDVLFTVQYELDNNIALKLGYRMFEASTDVDELYNFRLLNYVVIGPVLTF